MDNKYTGIIKAQYTRPRKMDTIMKQPRTTQWVESSGANNDVEGQLRLNLEEEVKLESTICMQHV
jgi:hypothetical protein